MSKREDLVASAEALLWQRGYEATSPKAILAHCGAGQGSMYHHFSGKEALAVEALGNHERHLWEATERALARPGLRGIRDWLGAERDPLSGCRLGRLANEFAVRNTPALRASLETYFDKLAAALEERLLQAREAGELPRQAKARRLAAALTATVQGGYVLALATQDAKRMDDALAGAKDLLRLAAA